MRYILFLALVMSCCARFGPGKDDPFVPAPKPPKAPVMDQQPICDEPKLIPTMEQRGYCFDICRGTSKTAREARSHYVRCTCYDGKVFRLRLISGGL